MSAKLRLVCLVAVIVFGGAVGNASYNNGQYYITIPTTTIGYDRQCYANTSPPISPPSHSFSSFSTPPSPLPLCYSPVLSPVLSPVPISGVVRPISDFTKNKNVGGVKNKTSELRKEPNTQSKMVAENKVRGLQKEDSNESDIIVRNTKNKNVDGVKNKTSKLRKKPNTQSKTVAKDKVRGLQKEDPDESNIVVQTSQIHAHQDMSGMLKE
ncbi:MAG: hypothetical protein LBG13_02050 [Holosporales bacterium]|jgi:hypothetical protein|nr:hypothetical protein [Holosporales bacterium]